MVFRARDQMGREAAVSVSNKAIALVVTLPALALGAGIPGVILGRPWPAWPLSGSRSAPPAARHAAACSSRPARPASSSAAGAPILAMTAAASVQPYLDAILLSKLAPAAVVGWFGAAKNVLGTLMAPADHPGRGLVPAAGAGFR